MLNGSRTSRNNMRYTIKRARFKRYVRTAALSAPLLMMPAAAGEAVSGSDAVDMSLSQVEVSYPGFWTGELDHAKTEITFRLVSKDEQWILWEPCEEETKRREGEKKTPEGFRSFFMRDNDHVLRLNFWQDGVPPQDQVELERVYKLARSKKGRALPPVTIKLGQSGEFETGGIRFSYTSSPGSHKRTEEGWTGWLGSVKLSYPEQTKLASIEIRDEKGHIMATTPAERRAGRAVMTLLPHDMEPVGSVQITAILSEAEETFDLPIRQIVSLGSAAGREKPSNEQIPIDQEQTESVPSEWRKNPSVACPVDVRLGRVSLLPRPRREEECPGMSLQVRAVPREGMPLFVSRTHVLGGVPVRDALGNEWNMSAWVQDDEKNGGILFYLSSERFPAGDWIELRSVPMWRARKLKSLPPQTIPLGRRGSFEAGGVRVDYKPYSSSWAGPRDRPGLSLTLDADGRFADVEFRDADGKKINTDPAGSGWEESSVTHDYLFKQEVQGEVQAIVTLREDAEPCVVPLNIRVGLDGMHKMSSPPSGESTGNQTSKNSARYNKEP